MQAKKWAEIVAKSFAAELIKLRKARGISMNELSVRTGLARSFITYMEKGERIPSLETLARIGFALGVSPGELVKRTEKAAGPVPRFKKML
jgi:XRE family transcriptional regulator, regulator of sulfur utilization